ncbi:MAG: YafY family transcriptional regulator [Saccharospirillaceae bacterium]|nr:YafY family transcriptional regulator [Pseudomonadales bacterium]NRB81301.1 YafY family transcriptional regulator [Saccharospirillaceae bacterium]
MSRTDLLFQITQIIKSRKFTTAQYLADRLNISTRTVYRYINELSVSGIPILSQTGKGYWLDQHFDLTPVHLSQEELLALSFGSKLVKCFADPFLADAAQQVLDKIEAVTPKSKTHFLNQIKIHAPVKVINNKTSRNLTLVRKAAELKLKVCICYEDQNQIKTDRIIWPLALAFWGKSWTIAAWCEKRSDFRAFRVDRMDDITCLKKHFVDEPDKNLESFVKQQNL